VTARLLPAAGIALVLIGLAAACGSSSAPNGSGAARISLVDKTWHCKKHVDLALVQVVMHGGHHDGVHLDHGCSGTIRKLVVVGPGGDGVKVHAGAHDVTILGGRIDCGPKGLKIHQDAIQAMGGMHVTFERISSRGCANSFMFVNEGRQKREAPKAIVCRNCTASSGNYSISIRHSTDSGATDSTFASRRPPAATAVAVDPLVHGNTWHATSRTRG